MPAIIFAAPGPVLVTDGTNIAAVKPAATAPLVADPALVVALSPNAPMPLPSGAATETTLALVKTNTDELDVALSTRASQATAATIAAATASIATETDIALSTRASESTLATRASEATLATRAADATLTGGTARTKVTDGTNNAAVKAASTAPVATDPALVVALSPNSPISVSASLAGSDGLSPQLVTVKQRNGIGEMAVSDDALARRLDEIALMLQEVLESRAVEVNNRISDARNLSVSASLTNITILAANSNRKAASFFNDSTVTLYLKMGKVATTSDFTLKVLPGQYFELPIPPGPGGRPYPGQVDGLWDSATGAVRITEYS